jgi:hypothetical protein
MSFCADHAFFDTRNILHAAETPSGSLAPNKLCEFAAAALSSQNTHSLKCCYASVPLWDVLLPASCSTSRTTTRPPPVLIIQWRSDRC